MREMKDSGIEWIGRVPVTWDVFRNKNAFSFNKEIVGDRSSATQLLSLTTKGIKKKDINSAEGKLPETFDTYQVVNVDDLVMCLFDLDVSAVFSGLSPYSGMISPAYKVITCTEKIMPKYADYWFQYVGHGRKFNHYAKNLRFTLNFDEFSSLPMLYPPISEQKKITDYLDKKCSKIDEIIEKQQAIIEKLKEYKLSIITEAVTKGLNPNAEMKDSGVEWLGKYPAHWNYYAFKNVLFERNEKNMPIKTDERLSLSIDKGVTLYSEKTTNLDRYKDDVSQYKIAHAGDLIMNSMNMIVGAVGVSDYFGCVSPAYYTYYDTEQDHITARYCDYLIRCKTMRKVLHSLGKGILSIDRGDDRINTCRLKVSRNDLRQLKIPVPPISEQREIVTYLEEKEKFIDKTIKDREIVIAKLQEYKKSLIYEVVTGKKEVEA